MKEQLIGLLDELESLGRAGTHTFLKQVAEDDMDSDMWERLQLLLTEIQTKSQKAFNISADLKRN